MINILEKCKLQGHLYERIWTHLLFFDKLFPINFECENVHVKIIHQPGGENTKNMRARVYRMTYLQIWLWVSLCVLVLPLQSVSRCC